MHIADISLKSVFLRCQLYTVHRFEFRFINVSNFVLWIDKMVAFVNVSITFNNQIILAGLLENTTCMPIPQKTADKAFKLTNENFTHIVFNPLHKNG